MDARISPIRGVCLLLLIGVAVSRVSSAPVSTKDGKDEGVTKNKELNAKEKAATANKESVLSSSSENSASSATPAKKSLPSSKIEPVRVNPVPVSVPTSSVPVNPVPGQMQRVLLSSNQEREGSNAAESEGRRTSDDNDGFLEEDEEDDDLDEEGNNGRAAAADLQGTERDGDHPWQYPLTDRRIQDLMADSNQDRQRFDSYPLDSSFYPSTYSSESLNSRALIDYLIRTGQIDRTLGDLVEAGVMTSEEATLYREAINEEYGPNPQLASSDGDVSPQVAAVDPEVIYDDGEPAEALYDGPNYLQPLLDDYRVPADDYLSLSSQPQQQSLGDDEDESMVRSEDDYGQYTASRFKDDEEEAEERNELLRDLLGTIALQEDGDRLSYKSLPAENEVQKPNLSSATSQWNSVEKQYDDDRGAAVERELEALPTIGEGVKTDGTLEEQQLEEMRNRVRPEKTKQDNRTKPIKNNQ